MQTSLPTVGDLMNGKWDLLEPHYRDLQMRQLTAENVADWLSDWSRLSKLVAQVGSQLYIATTINTADEEAEKRYLTFLETIDPPAQVAAQRLKQKLLDSSLEPVGFELQLRNMRTQAEIFREANLPLFIEEEKLEADYNKISGVQTVQWEGQEFTIPRLAPVYEDPDREKREKAWRLIAERRLVDRDRLNALWDLCMTVRQQMAANTGLDYRTFRWKQFLRFDYSPDDCKQFAQAIEEVVVPATRRLYEKRRQRLGLTTLRPWDLNVDPANRPPMHPFQSVDELESKVAVIFSRLDLQLSTYFEAMRREKLLDLENRKNKAPGGYCIWSETETPFIFMNAVGTHNDIVTLVHEAGHSFHNFETRHLPYYQQLRPGREFTEVASTAMELLTAPYLADEGGFYSPEEAARARIKYLENAIAFWPYMARVDLFQHWVYENPADGRDPAKCDERWAALVDQFNPGVDWSGLEIYKMTGWQHTPRHIFLHPFYYVEYGLSSLGAFQIWRNSLRNPAEAIASYRKALSCGGTLPLRQLYEIAGARFALDADTLREIVDLIEQTIAELESSL